MRPVKLKCNSVFYRKGFLEISAGIHAGCVNLEAWDIEPSLDISALEIGSDAFPEDAIQGNTELELDLQTAEALVQALQLAIETVRNGKVA